MIIRGPIFLKNIESNNLKCPSCSGQMVITEAKPGDKIAKCQYCDTIVDLPDDHVNEGFDFNSFFGNLDLSKFKNGTTTTTTTTRTAVTMMTTDGEEITDLEKKKEMLNKMKDLLKKSLDSKGLKNNSLDIDGPVDLSE